MRKFALLAAVGASLLWTTLAAAEVFSLAVIPDTQLEVREDSEQLPNRLAWLIAQKDALNLKMVLHVGDVHDWDTPDHDQFRRMSERFEALNKASIPYAMAIGNHDTAAVKVGGSAAPGNVNANLRVTDTFNRFYPPERFIKLAGMMEPGKVDNAFHRFEAGGLNWLVVNIELWPRDHVIAWAKQVIEQHADHNVIVLTHSFLNGRGEIEPGNGGYGNNSPRRLFEEAIKPFGHVKMVFSGHTGNAAYRAEPTSGGQHLHAFLQCIHSRATNPVRILEIDTEAGTIQSRIYSPMTNETRDDGAVLVKDVEWVKAPAPAAASVDAGR